MYEKILEREGSDALLLLKEAGFSDAEKTLRNIELIAKTLGTDLKSVPNLIDALVKYALSSPLPDDSLNNLERILSSCDDGLVKYLLLKPSAFSLQPLAYIAGSSNFLSNILVKDPSNVEYLFLKNGISIKKGLNDFFQEIVQFCPSSDTNSLETIAKALRQYREREYLRIGARDVLNLATMEETTQELSDLASSCLDTASRFSLDKLKKDYGAPIFTDIDGSEREAEFTVIGMGKLGGRELNFSSDIDIIYIYSSDKGEVVKETFSPPLDACGGMLQPSAFSHSVSLHAFFVKLSELITKLIGQVTEDGFVFRVDLNLRPEGKNGDLANSLRSAEIYYESWGQTWERAAMLKARPVAGSLKLGEDFLKMLEPFIYRKFLDFTAIEEIKTMKEKIDLSLLRRSPDMVDVKLGYGGIREIEFFVQAMQIINAGKDKEIRAKNTLETIKLLERKGYISAEDSNTLRESYIFLRNVEHKIQIVEGRQTQAIPSKDEEITRLARLMGFKDESGVRAEELFLKKYKDITEGVHEVYEKLFYKPSEELQEGISKDISIILSDETEETEGIEVIKRFGFKDVGKASENIRLLKQGHAFVHISQKASNVLNKILPFLLSRIVSSPDPDMALTHLERFISKIGGRGIFYSLLAENKKVMELLVKLFSTSAFLSHTFIEHPEIMDYLLSRDVSKVYKNKDEIREELSLILDGVLDYEKKLDNLRRFKNTEILRIGINDIFDELDLTSVSRQITSLADVSIEKALEIGIEELSNKYGMPSDKRFSVLGLGKLGGEEITYSSDLDLIFVYAGGGETNGLKLVPAGIKRGKITNHEFFVKLCQKIITVLSIITREGFVFKVDARLRPSGSSGPLVITREAFLKYHEKEASVWERQAMLRARCAAGDMSFGKEIIKPLHEIIYKRPVSDEDISELLRIRNRMELEIAKETPDRYNIKTGKGGLVDIEFAVQVLQLKYGGRFEDIRTANTIKGIERLLSAGLLSQEEASELKEAYNFYRLMENRIRIVNDKADDVLIKGSEALLKLAKRLGFEGDDTGDRLMETYQEHSKKVREIYLKVMK